MSKANCDKTIKNTTTKETTRREQKPIYARNEEVYIWTKHEIPISKEITWIFFIHCE